MNLTSRENPTWRLSKPIVFEAAILAFTGIGFGAIAGSIFAWILAGAAVFSPHSIIVSMLFCAMAAFSGRTSDRLWNQVCKPVEGSPQETATHVGFAAISRQSRLLVFLMSFLATIGIGLFGLIIVAIVSLKFLVTGEASNAVGALLGGSGLVGRFVVAGLAAAFLTAIIFKMAVLLAKAITFGFRWFQGI